MCYHARFARILECWDRALSFHIFHGSLSQSIYSLRFLSFLAHASFPAFTAQRQCRVEVSLLPCSPSPISGFLCLYSRSPPLPLHFLGSCWPPASSSSLPFLAYWNQMEIQGLVLFLAEPDTEPCHPLCASVCCTCYSQPHLALHIIVLSIKHCQGPLPVHICIELSEQVWPRYLGAGGPDGTGGTVSSHTCQPFSFQEQCPCELALTSKWPQSPCLPFLSALLIHCDPVGRNVGMWDFLIEENKEHPLPPSLGIMLDSFLPLSCCHPPPPAVPYTLL